MNQTLRLYDESTLEPIDKAELNVRNSKTDKAQITKFVVIRNAPTAIIRSRTSRELGLIKVCKEYIANRVNTYQVATISKYLKLPKR